MNFGNIALVLALASGLIALPAYWLWARGNTDWQRVSPVASPLPWPPVCWQRARFS